MHQTITTLGSTEDSNAARIDHEGLCERRRREGAQFGGVKIGVAFFRWLTAVGMAVLLTALIGEIGARPSLVADVKTVSDAANATDATDASTSQVGWAGAIVVLVAVALAYYSGGYVSGRMARFDGLRQGVAVFGWSAEITIMVAILGAIAIAIAGTKYDVLGKLNACPRIPSSLSDHPCKPWCSWSASFSPLCSAPWPEGSRACTSTARSTP